jgi:hypothetical protein
LVLRQAVMLREGGASGERLSANRELSWLLDYPHFTDDDGEVKGARRHFAS